MIYGFSIKRFLGRTWVMFAVLAVVYLFYLQSVKKKHMLIASLDSRIEALCVEREAALKVQGDLKLQICSQSDPAWIEMTLMKQLGVVPEGQQKVLFTK